MSSPISLTPEEVVARVRAQLAAREMPPVVIRPAAAGSSLYGLPVKVEGVGVVGQYLGHTSFTVSTQSGVEEMWEIVYGVTELFARVDADNAVAFIPVAVNGVLAPDARALFESDQPPRLYEHKRVLGSIIVPRRAIINLEDAMAGRDLVLRIDPYGVEAPGDLRRRVAELARQLEHVRRAYTALVGEYEAERGRREVAEAQLGELLSRYESLKGQLATVQSTVAAAEATLLDMWSRLRAVSSRAASERQLREQLTALLDDISSSVEAARKALQWARQVISEVVELKGAAPAAPEAVPPRPAEGGEKEGAAGREEGEEGGGEEATEGS